MSEHDISPWAARAAAIERDCAIDDLIAGHTGGLLPGDGWKVVTVKWTWRGENECPPEEELARRLNEERFQKIVSVTPVTLATGDAAYNDTVEVLVVGY